MGNDITKRRRREVAWICFEPYLSEEELLKSIQMLEREFQADSISNLITYITRICSEFGIDSGIRRPLCSQFHEMMSQDTEMLIDPIALLA